MLQKQEDQGKIDLYYFDESGFTLDPYIPYAWQEPGTVIEIPVRKCGRINVLGFMNRKNDLHPFIFEQSVHTSVVIACFEEFSKTLKKKTVVGKAASSPCLRPGSTLALRGRGFHPALDQGDAHAPLEPQHKVPRPNGRGLNG